MKLKHFITAIICAGLTGSFAYSQENREEICARVMGVNVAYDAVGYLPGDKLEYSGETCSVEGPVQKLSKIIWQYAYRDYIRTKELRATDGEVRELEKYQREFMKRKSKERKEELKEIRKALKDASLDAKKRGKLEEEKKLLENLEKHEIYFKKTKKSSKEENRAVYAPWVESWKLNKAVYEQYGGDVEMTKFGPNPVRAKEALLKEYKKQGLIQIFDDNLDKAYWESLSQKPEIVVPPEEVDFTPHWKKK
ncbi:MAG: hypothetical protein ABII64_07600 [Elusimicrobiota bacterium]